MELEFPCKSSIISFHLTGTEEPREVGAEGDWPKMLKGPKKRSSQINFLMKSKCLDRKYRAFSV